MGGVVTKTPGKNGDQSTKNVGITKTITLEASPNETETKANDVGSVPRPRRSTRWVPPTSKKQQEAVRFREKKKGFQGFRTAVKDQDGEEEKVEEKEMYSYKDAGEKTEEDMQTALEKLVGCPIMDSAGNTEAVFAGMYEVKKSAGEVIYKQGQMVPYFYIVIKGDFHLGDTSVGYANEQVFVADMPAEMEFKAVTDGTLWAIGRLRYQQIMVHSLMKRLELGESLLKNITEIPGLKELPKEQRQAIAEALKPVKFKKGEYLMRQQEEGHTMYFIEEGEVVIRQNTKLAAMNKSFVVKPGEDANVGEGGEKKESEDGYVELARRLKGEYIGEGALLDQDKGTQTQGLRMADAVAATDVSCLALSEDDFSEHMGSLRELFEHNMCCRVLRSLELMKKLSDEQLQMIVSTLEECEFEPGEYIVHQGEQGDIFYIIKEGTLECTILETDEQEEPTRIGTLIAGDYFGEGALLTNEPRRCNVIAAGPNKVRAWALRRRNFERYIEGEVREVLGKNFSRRKGDKDEGTGKEKVEWADLQQIRTLGSGSYGTVDLLRHTITGATYALKRIRKATVVAKRQQRFIKNEKALLSMMHSPFIVNLIRTFNKGDSVYMLTEVCLGGELYSLMKDTVDQKLTLQEQQAAAGLEEADDFGVGCFEIENQCRFFTACIVLAIEYVHSLGIIHRDIKPENLLLSDKGYLKMADFGFAKMVHEHRTYSLCGTPEYTAPEVYKRCGHGKGVDWWALGVILYEMASGFSPFHVMSQNSWDCYIEVSKYEKFYPNIHFPGNFGDSISNLLLRLMNPNPNKRYGTRKNNATTVKQHNFFKANGEFSTAMDFKSVENMEYLLPEQFRPRKPESGMDANNFEACEDPHAGSAIDPDNPPPAGSSAHDNWDVDF